VLSVPSHLGSSLMRDSFSLFCLLDEGCLTLTVAVVIPSAFVFTGIIIAKFLLMSSFVSVARLTGAAIKLDPSFQISLFSDAFFPVLSSGEQTCSSFQRYLKGHPNCLSTEPIQELSSPFFYVW
jgi:hypothetical protein